MNRKGQVLVAFVILLPLLFIVLALIIDLGNLYIEKRNVENNIKDALKYSLNNLEDSTLETKIRNQLNLNIDNVSFLKIEINDKIIEIKLKKNIKGIFTSVLNKSYTISSYYKGYIKDEEIIIRKEA